MAKLRRGTAGWGLPACLLVLMITGVVISSADPGDKVLSGMVLVKGGIFLMGDVFDEGQKNEKPVHQVTLPDFYLARYEVTVGEFRQFVEETGYKTSAEGSADPAARQKIMEKFAAGNLTREEMGQLKQEMLLLSGAGYWDAELCRWTGYEPSSNWQTPGFKQADSHPVIAVSPDDARQYCNWLSTKNGLPGAYDLETGGLLDAQGKPTTDLTAVRGFRLPSEAEWEYAAREGGRRVRFGSGSDTARSGQINFRANAGDYPYLEIGGYRKTTTPVGSFPPNDLGLYDMSGNAWEWAGDRFAEYSTEAQTNPYCTDGDNHALRGGRWGGDAFEARVFSRSPWVRNDRCNNSGFRIARSK